MKGAFSLSGAGNRFVLLDCMDGVEPSNVIELARELCDQDLAQAGRQGVDGLMLALPAEVGGDVKMVLYNADGTRPETCGNGLRCIGRWFWKSSDRSSDTIAVETDAGISDVQLSEHDDAVHVHIGSVWVGKRPETVQVLGGEVKLLLANVGNPHCIVLVDDLVEAPVQELGAALQAHSRFPHGINVEFVSLSKDEANVRVYERGVGETLACGTGACAVAGVLRAHSRWAWPVRVRMAGGVLDVHGDGEGGVWLTGPVQEHELDEHTKRCLENVYAK